MTHTKSLAATIVVPTSIDRGPTLTLAVESVLQQTISNLEVFIIGDGAAEVTRQAARALELADSRVRFFDHPKHPRRGEPYRHAALQEARGRIVCYLVDRDLYLPDHVEEMSRLLMNADMAHSFLFGMGERGYQVGFSLDLSHTADRRRLVQRESGIPLAFGAHTLDAYNRLRDGWSTTPPGRFTDGFFWAKFSRDPAMRCVSGSRPTVLNFPRGSHPGWSVARRLPELQHWAERMRFPDGPAQIRAEIINAALRDREACHRLLRGGIVVAGVPATPGSLFVYACRKLKSLKALQPLLRARRKWLLRRVKTC